MISINKLKCPRSNLKHSVVHFKGSSTRNTWNCSFSTGPIREWSETVPRMTRDRLETACRAWSSRFDDAFCMEKRSISRPLSLQMLQQKYLKAQLYCGNAALSCKAQCNENSPLHDSPVHDSPLHDSPLHDSPLHNSSTWLLYTTILYTTLLYTTLLYMTLLHMTLLYVALSSTPLHDSPRQHSAAFAWQHDTATHGNKQKMMLSP